MLEINEKDIDKVEEIGEMNGSAVKMIKTTGGFYIAIGKLNGKNKPISTGSHPAICKYMCSKYDAFKPLFAKSEGFQTITEDISKSLAPELLSKGYSLFSVKESEDKEVIILNHRTIEIGRSELDYSLNKAEMSDPSFEDKYQEKTLRKYIYRAALNKAEENGVKELEVVANGGYTICTVEL